MAAIDKKAVFKLLRAIGWVCLLGSVVLFIPAYFLYKAGELTTVEKVCERQKSNDKVLWGLAYSEQQKIYKLTGTRLNQPEILALGNSRVMPFRKEFFNKEVKFYNAGGGVKILAQYKTFLENLPDTKIDFLLISLDDFMFAPNWANLDDTLLGKDIFERNTAIRNVMNSYQMWYDDYLKKKFTFRQVLHRDENKIGYNAIVKNVGYRSDGSWYYGGIIADPKTSVDYGFVQTKSMVEKGTVHYVHSQTVNEEAFKQLDDLLAYCKQRNIKVLAFVPTFSPTIHNLMEGKKASYAYKNGLFERIKASFNKHGFWVYDYSNPATLNCMDEEFIDGHHGGEKVYARLALNLADSCAEFSKYLNGRDLKKGVETTGSPLYVFRD